jgi:hypothetical protein
MSNSAVIDPEHRDFPVCPHCGHALCDPVDMPQSVDAGEMDCDECGGECTWERFVTVTFTTRKPNLKLTDAVKESNP